MERLICLAIGYVCGLFQTGYIVGEMSHVDIRKKGSGNAGTTNALRVLGWKAGLLTFAGDVLKCVAAFLIVFFLYRGSGMRPLLALYAGAGVTLGHNYPFYMNFKGGKGIAVMAGLVVVNSFWHLPASLLLIPVTLAAFLIPVIVTRYISVGSLAAYTVFLLEMILIGNLGWFQMADIRCIELYAVLFLMTALAWYRHRENLKRLAAGSENKFGSKKKEK
ncbi:MAG TPA: glycerol-3-phosphate acyltransferase [Candidatus Mediterraneibacter merdipullorum]|nr:glycerol-3-phosphate acyltransferase [Candidatus Mediterraneibacter merdipullorum]